jgi:hypothetical protein
MNGSLQEDPQARWNISQVDGNYVITQAGSFKNEYLVACSVDDSRGGFFVHTWANGSLQNDPKARWSISKVGGNYVITHASFKDAYLRASQPYDSRGWRYVHALVNGSSPADDQQALWTITPVAKLAGNPTHVSGKASSGPVSALQVDAAWWPWGKTQESTTQESTNNEKAQVVPLGEVVITHAGSFKDEYLYATPRVDSYGGRYVNTWMNGSLQEDPQARWNISQVGGNYVITHAGSFKNEYLVAVSVDDSRGGLFVHTWANGSLQNDPKARWSISKVGGNYVITHASFKDAYLSASQPYKKRGWRYVHALVKGGSPADDPQALWTIAPVAKLVGNPSRPGCYMRMPLGCPKKPDMKTQLWRHDAWAEAHDLDKAGCEERKRTWDKHCEADDAMMFFVPKPPKQ